MREVQSLVDQEERNLFTDSNSKDDENDSTEKSFPMNFDFEETEILFPSQKSPQMIHSHQSD